MAKHMYDDTGKYKGKILSDEERRIKVAHSSYGWWQKCYFCRNKLRGLIVESAYVFAEGGAKDICSICNLKSKEIKEQLIQSKLPVDKLTTSKLTTSKLTPLKGCFIIILGSLLILIIYLYFVSII